jgi:hypothetical protein
MRGREVSRYCAVAACTQWGRDDEEIQGATTTSGVDGGTHVGHRPHARRTCPFTLCRVRSGDLRAGRAVRECLGPRVARSRLTARRTNAAGSRGTVDPTAPIAVRVRGARARERLSGRSNHLLRCVVRPVFPLRAVWLRGGSAMRSLVGVPSLRASGAGGKLVRQQPGLTHVYVRSLRELRARRVMPNVGTASSEQGSGRVGSPACGARIVRAAGSVWAVERRVSTRASCHAVTASRVESVRCVARCRRIRWVAPTATPTDSTCHSHGSRSVTRARLARREKRVSQCK